MIHFVGAGPGAPDLITVRGAQLLGSAHTVIYAGSLVNPELLSLAPKDSTIYDSSHMTLEQVVNLMAQAAEKDEELVRLHTGDPSLYGAIHEQMIELDKRGIAYDLTPGVSSFSAAAASLRAEYTIPGVSQSLVITRLAGRTPVPHAEQLRSFARHGASMAIFLSAGMLPQVQRELELGGYAPNTPVALVYKASWPDERILHSCVGQLAHDGEKASITHTALVLVGDVLAKKGERSRLYDPNFSTGFREAEQPSHSRKSSTSTKPSVDIRIISFSEQGQALADNLAEMLAARSWRCEPGKLTSWTQEAFNAADALVFVGAAGIAVRAIASHLRSKDRDPAVVVVDEQGGFAVPILSGHLGGANALATRIADICGAVPVITTATDRRGVFAIDEWAREHGCTVANPSQIKRVSSRLLSGGTVRLHSKWNISGEVPQGIELVDTDERCDVRISARPSPRSNVLQLIPRMLVLGLGCRRSTSAETLLRRTRDLLEREGFDERALACVCSIDAKADEAGIIELCNTLNVAFVTFSASELSALPGSFTASKFVQSSMGVDNVCERSAVLGSAGGELICKKDAGEGTTLALAAAPFTADWRY